MTKYINPYPDVGSKKKRLCCKSKVLKKGNKVLRWVYKREHHCFSQKGRKSSSSVRVKIRLVINDVLRVILQLLHS